MAERRIVILGSGPTGLGAAWRLNELRHDNWQLFEAADYAGGLGASFMDSKGFTWDIGGHVVFSHYEYFDRMLDEMLGQAWVEHIREAWIWMRQRFIPYPLQTNIWRLPDEDLLACLDGLLEVYKAPPQNCANFAEWIYSTFGRGLAEVFMNPYNFKVWAYPPAEMGIQWMGERVAKVDLARVLHNIVLKKDDVSWGPNAKFRFPLHGGTGAIWRTVFKHLPSDRCHLSARVKSIDQNRKEIEFSDGTRCDYDILISTVPVDMLLAMMYDRQDLRRAAWGLKYSSSHIIGVGLHGQPPENLKTKCWMYFPESDYPFYRTTVFSNYSPNNVANPGSQWSLMAEVSESPHKAVDSSAVVAGCVAGFKTAGFIQDESAIVDTWYTRVEHGYPTPSVGRDAIMSYLDQELSQMSIRSRGRFGAWKYEVANMDHCMMQGVETVDNLLLGQEEITLRNSGKINGGGKQPIRPIQLPAAAEAG